MQQRKLLVSIALVAGIAARANADIVFADGFENGDTTAWNAITTCYSDVRVAPRSCRGGVVTLDEVRPDGGRHLLCAQTGRDIGELVETIAYNKPGDSDPQWFEIYRTGYLPGQLVQACLGNACVDNDLTGFDSSPEYPACETVTYR